MQQKKQTWITLEVASLALEKTFNGSFGESIRWILCLAVFSVSSNL